ncbi:putative DNA mismatch repair protein Mlh1 [Paratrimastix pyriformis]|uniref:DNA mismatch repair protein Mlh1 n=1 Tax=Paratrimastix pyriformis TaxID=342808 RepID=A0ABQ8UBE4_9EUKA|nr:putative DNA mismatch repair protein Mlh1 [Paratrimastix pyriformis]
MENSLDAGSTSISVLLQDGGTKALQITDNGHGIHPDDLKIICERFTTSKLAAYDDLFTLTTFGFRGEALASITHIARLSITTMTPGSQCAYRAMYRDGKLVGDPKPCAGVQGTQILVEDLFYNVLARRRALKSPAEEFARCWDVLSRYAIHYPKVTFSLRKQGEMAPVMLTHPAPASTTAAPSPADPTPPAEGEEHPCLNPIRLIYGEALARELRPPPAWSVILVHHDHHEPDFVVDGLVSNASYSAKKEVFILFINHRSVECAPLKKALDALYATYLPKQSHPFVYLSLTLDSRTVDPNVHPAKLEVRFLHQDAIISALVEVVTDVLRASDTSRTFYVQTLLPTGVATNPTSADADASGAATSAAAASKKSHHKKKDRDEAPRHREDGDDPGGADEAPTLQPYRMVRTDSKQASLDAFLSPTSGRPRSRMAEQAADGAGGEDGGGGEEKKKLKKKKTGDDDGGGGGGGDDDVVETAGKEQEDEVGLVCASPPACIVMKFVLYGGCPSGSFGSLILTGGISFKTLTK